MNMTIDLADVIRALVWPFTLLLLLIGYRTQLATLVTGFAPRIKSLSLAGLGIELHPATPLSPAPPGTAVDLRHAGTSQDVNDSTLRSFYEQVRDPTQLDYALVDLGTGREWLTSRLYVLSVILRRMRGLQAIVFVETAGHVRRHFVGLCNCDRARWRLAMRYPWFEKALADAESQVWVPMPPLSAPGAAPIRVVNDDGRLEGIQEPAAELLRRFLDHVQLGGPPPDPEWEILPSLPQKVERAQWLNGKLVEDIFGDALETSTVALRGLQGRPDNEKSRLIVEQPGAWVAITGEELVFHSLVNRLEHVDKVARAAVAAV